MAEKKKDTWQSDYNCFIISTPRRRGDLMVSALNAESSPGRERCVVLLGKAFHSYDATLHPGV